MRGFQTFNPQINDFNPVRYYSSTQEELELAVQKSTDAFLSFCNSPSTLRSDFLLEIHTELEKEKSTIQSFYCDESGLSPERFEIEFTRTLFQLKSFSNFLLTEFEHLEILTSATDSFPSLRKTQIGIGPVFVLGSSNFPLAYSTIGGDSVAALAAGCPVIVKAHPMHVGTSLIVAKCVQKALSNLNLAEGIFQHLIDEGIDVATQLVKDEHIKAVGFTGSIKGGRALMDLASKRKLPIPVFAEMGSANPVVFLENGFEEKVNHFATIFAGSICNDAGQFCTKPGLFFIPSGEKGDELAARLTAEVMDSRPFLMLHPSIKNNFERLKKERSIFSPKTFIEKDGELHPMQGKPAILTIDSKLFINETTLQEEVFGPFALIIRYENLEDLSQCLNQLHGQLTGSIVSKTTTDANFIAVLNILSQKVGRIILNAIPTGVRVDEAMHHGGPYPATSDSRFTAVGTQSIYRFLRNITFQNFN